MMNDKATWLTRLKNDPTPWLLTSNSWTRYRTLVDLLDLPLTDGSVVKAKQDLINNPQITSLVADAALWFPRSITKHNDPKICFYKLRMLTDFGFTQADPGMKQIIQNITAHLADGMYATRQTLPQKNAGFFVPDPTADKWHALPCDTPLITYALLQMGINDEPMQRVIDTLTEKWATPQGWFCHFFFVEGQYRKLKIGCPMAGLMALEVFSLLPNLKESPAAMNAYQTLKFHKDYGQSVYFFGRSKKFWTLKYPFVWYNALYLAEVLTRFEFTKDEPLVRELIQWIEDSQDQDGRFKPNSMYQAYKDWDFANKKEPSPWITLLCCKILKRCHSRPN